MITISDLCYLVLLVCIEFTTYVCTVEYLFHIPPKRGRGRWILCVGILLLIHVAIACMMEVRFSECCAIVTMAIIPFMLFRDKRVILLHLYIILAYSSFSAIMIDFFSLFGTRPEQKVLDSNWVMLMIYSIPLAIVLLYGRLNKSNQKLDFQYNLGMQQILFLVIGTFCVYIVMGAHQVIGRYIENVPLLLFDRVVATIACLIFWGLIIWQGVVASDRNQLDEETRRHIQFEKLQSERFREKQEQDEALRHFRHDYRAHLIALQGYCKQGKNIELGNYLEQILQHSSNLATKSYLGDPGVDAVISHLAEQAKQGNIVCTIEGTSIIPEEMIPFELSGIFSNLLTNAIEACERIEEIEQRYINLKIGTYNEKMVIQLENSRPIPVSEKEKTWKDDKINHGLGMENVRKIVMQHGGYLVACGEGNKYNIEIIL